MITLKSCPVCGSKQVGLYREAGLAPHVLHEIMPGVRVNAAIITRYFQCQGCGLIFQNPRLSNSELNRFYKEGVYRRTLNLSDKVKDIDEKYRAKVDSEIIRKHVGKIESHLDVGASRGFLLDEIGAKAKVVVESDISGVSVKGVKVYPKMSKVLQKSFDLVTAIHTLEHVPDPVGYLRGMSKFIGKDGCLVVEVPTWKSPGGPLRLSHLYHFEPDVLKLMCMRIGLDVVHVDFTPHLLLICKKTVN